LNPDTPISYFLIVVENFGCTRFLGERRDRSQSSGIGGKTMGTFERFDFDHAAKKPSKRNQPMRKRRIQRCGGGVTRQREQQQQQWQQYSSKERFLPHKCTKAHQHHQQQQRKQPRS
jgi:hypothetical protein